MGILASIVIIWLVVRTIVTQTIAHKPLASSDTIASTLMSKRALVAKVTGLQTELASYDARLATLDLLKAENDALKAELGRTPRTKGTLAHVVTLPNKSLYDTMTIDAGTRDGLREGQVAYAFGSVALGTVSAVYEDHATVRLFSASGRETTGTTNENNVVVTLIGRGAGEYEVHMPRDISFAVGGLITYQSTDPVVLAQIQRIATDPRDPFQKLYAKAPINLQALKWVIVR